MGGKIPRLALSLKRLKKKVKSKDSDNLIEKKYLVTLMQEQIITIIPRVACNKSWPFFDQTQSSSIKAKRKLKSVRSVTKTMIDL